MKEYRFFKCNVLGGFRLSDLNKNIKQNEYFFIESQISETSRAMISALNARWMIEVTEKEASKYIAIPKEEIRKVSKNGVSESSIGKKGAVNRSLHVAIPDVQTVNKKLESRQTEANRMNGNKPIIPDFKKVEEEKKKRDNDSINKIGASSDEELLSGLKDVEKAIGPDFNKRSSREEIKIIKCEEKEEIKIEEIKIIKDEEKDAEIKEIKSDEKEVVVTALSDDSVFDNTGVSTPNFDEKDVVIEKPKKRGRRKKVKVEVEEKK